MGLLADALRDQVLRRNWLDLPAGRS